MPNQKRFLLFAIIAGVAGIIIGGIIFAITIINFLHA
jgi:hypothetical protein